MPRPNSESNRLMLLRQRAGRSCCTRTKVTHTSTPTCICSTCITCPLTFPISLDYVVNPGYIIRKISSVPNSLLASMQSYDYQNVRLSLTYIVDITKPQVFVALSPTQSYSDAIYILTIDSNGITLQVEDTSITAYEDVMFVPYWSDGRVLNITLTTIPGDIPDTTRINININNGSIENDVKSLYPTLCGFHSIIKCPSVDTELKIDYFGLDRPC